MSSKSITQLEQQQKLIENLQQRDCFDHPVTQFQIIETHISWVILTGDFAYKMKKAVDFGFLNYSTLDIRKAQCLEELRLNGRTAPDIYLGVVAVGGTVERPVVGDGIENGPAIEYLVKMRQFSQQALLSHLVAGQQLNDHHIESLAQMIARFHASIDIAPDDSSFGTPERIIAPIRENFEQVSQRIKSPELLARLSTVSQQAEQQFIELEPLFTHRKQHGFIRDCHGDMHLNNILLIDNSPLLFDCIEFNASLRIFDVMSEIAFLIMDLEEHEESQRANLLLNLYLERSGDYEGIILLKFYLSYRAMVRAKVSTLRLDQESIGGDEQREVHEAFDKYLQMAERYSAPQTAHNAAQIIITHGLSGSGKTTLTTPLMQQLGAIRIRSDIERKRLFGLEANAESSSLNIYTPEATARTYQRLATLTRAIIAGGYAVIVDATFLKRGERDLFRTLASELDVPFTTLIFTANTETLNQRVEQRSINGNDASEADVEVLKLQLEHYRPLDSNEMESAIVIDSESNSAIEQAINRLNDLTKMWYRR